MRRMLILLTSAGMLGMCVGCMHGVCDCDVQPPGAPTGYLPTQGPNMAPPVAPVGGIMPPGPAVIPNGGPRITPEPIQVAPKVGLNAPTDPGLGRE